MPYSQLAAAGAEVSPAGRDDAGAQLLHRAANQRDEGAWRRLVETHHPAVLRQATRACGDPAAAEDIAQEVFLKVFRSARSFRGDRPLAHWIARITSTTAVDALRRRREQPAEIDESRAVAPGHDPAGEVTREESRRRVREAVLRLPGHLRDVVMLVTFAELTYEDAARELGIPLRTAMSRAMAARAQLRRVLVGLEDGA
ncbi:MAG TPA: RNA polymerase sigma factor [Candidatus Dormibacteraeota bacterium]|nr:RNA polymerase sigma factor [Candidatus Dormibacteraeota bacterium]